MALNITDLPRETQKHAKKSLGIRTRISQDSIKRHALAVAAMLLDERELPTTQARRVLQKAIKLLK